MSNKKGLLALSPLIILIALITLFTIYSVQSGDQGSTLSLTVAFMISSIYAVAISGGMPIKKRIDTYSKGAGANNLMLMLWIYVLAGAFAASAKAMGAVDATVNLALNVLPANMILPGLFLAACFISVSIGTSVGTVVALVPIAAGLAHSMNANIGLMTAIIVGGAYFGDNLSFISDTTVVATQTQSCRMSDKFRVNSMIVIPAAIEILIVYAVMGYGYQAPTHVASVDILKVVPYLVVLITAIVGINVISTRENERTLIFEDGTVKRYVYESYKNKYNRWIPDKRYIPGNRTYYWSVSISLYKKNFHAIKKIPMIQKSSLNCWDELPTSITDYLAVEKKYPVIEKLVKAGLFKLAKECIKNRVDMTELNHKETELAKILRIDNARLKRLKNLDGGDVGLRWLQYEKAANRIWPDEMIRDFDANELLSSSFGFISAPISYVKCWNYLKKQAAIMDESLKQALITWRDYVNMADQLGMNTALDQILKPKDVKKAHDELIILKQKEGMQKTAREIEKKWPKVNKQLQKLKKFEFAKGEYCIVAPENIFDIVKEGTILRHCVHTCDYYFDRISRDESYLFFLRQKSQPDIPWYTLEVEPNGNIRQKRTTGDNQNADFQKAIVFLKHWQQFFKQQLTEKEQELGEKADKLRKTNYAKLRKDGNRVWHGKLAGQLLADVLEKDFMEA